MWLQNATTMYLVALLSPGPLEELTTRGQNFHFGKCPQKCCMGVFCAWVKLKQIWKFSAVNCTEMRLAALLCLDPLGSYSAAQIL